MKKYDEKKYLGKLKSWLGLGALIYGAVYVVTNIVNWILVLKLSQDVIIAASGLIAISLLIAIKYMSKSEEAKHYEKIAEKLENGKKRNKKTKKKKK